MNKNLSAVYVCYVVVTWYFSAYSAADMLSTHSVYAQGSLLKARSLIRIETNIKETHWQTLESRNLVE